MCKISKILCQTDSGKVTRKRLKKKEKEKKKQLTVRLQLCGLAKMENCNVTVWDPDGWA